METIVPILVVAVFTIPLPTLLLIMWLKGMFSRESMDALRMTEEQWVNKYRRR